MVNQTLRYSIDSGWCRTRRLKLHGQFASLGVRGDFSRLRSLSGFRLHGLLLEVLNNAIIALLMRIAESSGWSEKDAAVTVAGSGTSLSVSRTVSGRSEERRVGEECRYRWAP